MSGTTGSSGRGTPREQGVRKHPDAFGAVGKSASEECSDASGADALGHVLLVLEFGEDGGVDLCWPEVKRMFVPLEIALMAQAEYEGAARLGWEEKVRLAWGVASSSSALIIALAGEEPDAWVAWRDGIEALG